MGELLRKRAWPEPVFSHVVRSRNAGCLPAVGAAKSDLNRDTREEPNADVKGRRAWRSRSVAICQASP